MSDDIVDRLMYLWQYQGPPTSDAMQEAATEITSLRAELARMREVPEDLEQAAAEAIWVAYHGGDCIPFADLDDDDKKYGLAMGRAAIAAILPTIRAAERGRSISRG